MSFIRRKIRELGTKLSFRTFYEDQRGSLFIFMALAIVPLLAFIGLSVDMNRTYHARSLVLNAADAAAMAAAKVPEKDAKAEAQRIFDGYIAGTSVEGKAVIDSVVVNTQEGYVDVTASTDVDMTFIQVIGYDTLSVDGTSRVVYGQGRVEVALVLDNTGSMNRYENGKTRMDHLKNAAFLFLDTLFEDEGEPDGVFVSVVPYVTQVNIGRRFSWLTKQGKALARDITKFPRGKKSRWRGCVEARYQGNHHNLDTPPTSQATKFMPYWWPSTETEPYPYPDGRVEPWGRFRRGDNDWTLTNISDIDSIYPIGPNAGCPAEVIPLTNIEADLRDTIEDMEGIYKGGTFVFSGLVWGWRVLSPKWRGLWDKSNPYKLPLDHGKSQKVIVIITDGENVWGGSDSPWSRYRDRQYTSFGRWYGSVHRKLNQSVVQPESMNSYTAQLCERVKEDGITIYSIVVSTRNQTAVNLMETCASGPDKFYEAQSSVELKAIFQEIADSIRNLRYSWHEVKLDS